VAFTTFEFFVLLDEVTAAAAPAGDRDVEFIEIVALGRLLVLVGVVVVTAEDGGGGAADVDVAVFLSLKNFANAV
jgi:hypothetical protein